MGSSTAKWAAAGALVSFGVVGFLTGLVLVPFGLALAFSAARTDTRTWPALLAGLGLGPVVLLAGDVRQPEPPTGIMPGFWVGVALIVAGTVLYAQARRAGHEGRHVTGSG